MIRELNNIEHICTNPISNYANMAPNTGMCGTIKIERRKIVLKHQEHIVI